MFYRFAGKQLFLIANLLGAELTENVFPSCGAKFVRCGSTINEASIETSCVDMIPRVDWGDVAGHGWGYVCIPSTEVSINLYIFSQRLCYYCSIFQGYLPYFLSSRYLSNGKVTPLKPMHNHIAMSPPSSPPTALASGPIQ
jgi:hypothetical protein